MQQFQKQSTPDKTIKNYDLVDSDDYHSDDGENILQDSGSDYEDELKNEKAKGGIFVGSDSESEDESKKQQPETSKVSPIPKQQPKTYSGGKKGEKTQQKVR